MAKTYGTVTTFTAGSVLTAAQLNVASTAVNNLVVPASAEVYRSSNQTGYTSGSAITWQATNWDTDTMWSAGSPTILTVNTAGIYVVTFEGLFTATATVTDLGARITRTGTDILNVGARVNSAGNAAYFSVTFLVNYAVGDTISANLVPTGGSAYIVNGAAEGISRTRLQAQWVGRTS